MSTDRLTTVLPVDDLDEGVAFWSAALDVAPTFVDGARWAQFDVGPHRLALAGTDRTSDSAGVLVKVDDLETARRAATARGLDVSPIEEGPHEHRFSTTAPGGWVVTFYAPAR